MTPSDLLHLRDPFSSLSHFSACLASCGGTVVFWRASRQNPIGRAALMSFGISLILLFAASATYHAFNLQPDNQRVLQLVDQSAIYILIAGTYTPTLSLLLKKGRVKSLSLFAIWTMALAGIICKWSLPELPYWLVVAPYIALGWVGVLLYSRLNQAVGLPGMKWIVFGGLAYSVGAIIDWRQWPDIYSPLFGPHELFHVWVMIGALCHVVFMIKYAAPYSKAADLNSAPGQTF